MTYSFRELHDGDFLRLYGKKLPSLDIEGFYEFKGSIREWLNCLVMPDASKICDVDIRQVAYDRVALPCAEAEYNFDLLYTCEEGSRERKCPHDHFHNTQHHETVCSIIGIDACHETHIL